MYRNVCSMHGLKNPVPLSIVLRNCYYVQIMLCGTATRDNRFNDCCKANEYIRAWFVLACRPKCLGGMQRIAYSKKIFVMTDGTSKGRREVRKTAFVLDILCTDWWEKALLTGYVCTLGRINYIQGLRVSTNRTRRGCWWDNHCDSACCGMSQPNPMCESKNCVLCSNWREELMLSRCRG